MNVSTDKAVTDVSTDKIINVSTNEAHETHKAHKDETDKMN